MQYDDDFSTNSTCAASGAGNCTVDPLNDPYSLHWKTVTLTSSPTSAQIETANNYVDQLSTGNLLVDYSFLPQLSSVISDYSGLANTGSLTGNIGFNYTSQGLWLNEQNAFSLNQNQQVSAPVGISGSSSATSFTMAIVFNKRQLPVNSECIVSGSNISICRLGTSLDTMNVSVLGSAYTDVNVPEGSWNELWIVYDSSTRTASIYDSSSFNGLAVPVPIGTITGISGSFSGSNFVLGQTATPPASSSLILAKFAVWNAALPNWLLDLNSEQINFDMRGRGIYLPRAIAPGEYALDFSPPLAAWSMRRLSTSYTGPLMRVVNSTTGAVADVYPTATGDLDANAITTLCPAKQNCYVDTWYDQSGKSLDLTSVTGRVNMAQISANGSVIVCSGGKPCAYFDGNEQYVATIPNSFRSETASASLVFEASTSAWNSWSSVFFAGTQSYLPANYHVSSWLMFQRFDSHQQLTWGRGVDKTGSEVFGPLTGPTLANNTLYTAWTVFDSIYQRFGSTVNSSSPPAWLLPVTKPGGLDGAQYYDGNERFQFANLALGTQPNGFVGYISEAIFFPYACGYKTIAPIANNQNSYFGVKSGTW